MSDNRATPATLGPSFEEAPLVNTGHITRCAGCKAPTPNWIDQHIGCCRSCYEVRRCYHLLGTLVTGDAEKDARLVDAFEREHGDILRGLGFQIDAGGEATPTLRAPEVTAPPKFLVEVVMKLIADLDNECQSVWNDAERNTVVRTLQWALAASHEKGSTTPKPTPTGRQDMSESERKND